MEKLKKLFNRYTVLAIILLAFSATAHQMGMWGLPDYLLITTDEVEEQVTPEETEDAPQAEEPAKDAGSTEDTGSSDVATGPKESALAAE